MSALPGRSAFERKHGLRIETPASDRLMTANIEMAVLRGLRPLPKAESIGGRIAIVANGPSAAGMTALDRAAMPVLAVNGALALFVESARGAAQYWLSIDPQAIVADFLGEAPLLTKYLVASHCHPAVFDALPRHLCDVRVWHARHRAADAAGIPASRQIDCGLSSTLAAIAVARSMGYRRIEVFGWDGCFDGDRHHAISQAMSAERVTVSIDGEQFETTATLIAEAHDAIERLPAIGAKITIHGQGMIAAAFRQAGANQK